MARYLVSFLDVDSRGQVAHGNFEYDAPHPITSMAHIDDLTAGLQQRLNLNRPVVMAFSPFEEAQR